jgi:hypothetical protein
MNNLIADDNFTNENVKYSILLNKLPISLYMLLRKNLAKETILNLFCLFIISLFC